jgi:hypothetical protein
MDHLEACVLYEEQTVIVGEKDQTVVKVRLIELIPLYPFSGKYILFEYVAMQQSDEILRESATILDAYNSAIAVRGAITKFDALLVEYGITL